jgi:Fuc2NAc and GlcNAc transferase
MQWLLNSTIFISSIALTWIITKVAWNVGLVDQPDERRSHQQVTPRGGGLAIVLVFWLWILGAAYFSGLPKLSWLPILPTLFLALVGFIDDLYSVSAMKRLALQFFFSGLSLYLMQGIHFQLILGGFIIPHSLVLFVSLVFLVWSINLYNFMDGINGLAGFEALTISIFMAIITYLDGDMNKSTLWGILASGVAGFLVWNFPKAKIFLGDVGSYFLGSMFGILLLDSANTKPRLFWCGLILLGYFVVDATLTLLVRIWFRLPAFKPHQTHAFQIMLKRFESNHTKVTSLVLSINFFWLLPWAILVSKGYLNGLMGVLIAYLPLVIIVWFVEAGRPKINQP